MICVSRSLLTACLLGLAAMAARADEAVTTVEGFVALKAGLANGQRSWLEGGHGRLSGVADDRAGERLDAAVEGRLILGWSSGVEWDASLHLLARASADEAGFPLGLVEAQVARRWFGEGQRWQLRLGQFFLPTSVENIERGWVSPYSLTHSALNSWIGEEFRPIGVDLGWRRELASGASLELAATVFGGNDASGALLAWRGFAWHDRLSVLGEVLPLPDLQSLRDPQVFGLQRDDGSKPFGPDLDGRPGAALRLRLLGERQRLNLALVDTLGDRQLYRGEYAWRTRFVQAGWERDALSEGWSYAAELLAGDTRMGEPGGPKAHIRFHTAYVLASYGQEPWRYTLRLEGFDIDDIDQSIAENNEEQGYALTLAALRHLGAWRLGLELLHVDGSRPATLAEGLPAQTGGTQLRVEARYLF